MVPAGERKPVNAREPVHTASQSLQAKATPNNYNGITGCLVYPALWPEDKNTGVITYIAYTILTNKIILQRVRPQHVNIIELVVCTGTWMFCTCTYSHTHFKSKNDYVNVVQSKVK